MDVMTWDLILLGVFVVAFSIFLYVKRKKINKEGLLLLYHTKWGLKLIDSFGKKHAKGLKILSYISVFTGYILMILMVYFFVNIVIVYIFQANIVRAIKIPPITPLIPYLPQIFKLDFLPPFYFSYWIIILAIVAITHEFFHGIFAKIAKVKTKTTGFGFFPFFLPVFLAAFVNLDEKAMAKKKKFEQMAVLSAGTFANILTAILGVILMVVFFSLSFSPSGVIYNDYAYGIVNMTGITSINEVAVENPSYGLLVNLTNQGEINEIIAYNRMFLGIKGATQDPSYAALYFDSPAIRNNLSGAITEIDGLKITHLDALSSIIASHSPGEKITLTTYNGTDEITKEITLEISPEGKTWIGISFENQQASGILGSISAWITSYKNPHIYYTANFTMAKFIYDLLWWLVLISFSVALVNMLPVGIFDGGRFFYLTIFAITKSEKAAAKTYKALTFIFLMLLLVLMIFWAKSFF
ncbi:site-2 protease family protein [Candidatus Pacearchaeota archaeon]|nr:site-2 protease family protein [Candidatus Pacearchaeota archaeon]